MFKRTACELALTPPATAKQNKTKRKGKRVRAIKETTSGQVWGVRQGCSVGEGSRGHPWWRLRRVQNGKTIKCPLEFANWSREGPTQGIWVEWWACAEEGWEARKCKEGFQIRDHSMSRRPAQGLGCKSKACVWNLATPPSQICPPPPLPVVTYLTPLNLLYKQRR